MADPFLLQVVINDVTADDWEKLYRFLKKTDAVLKLSINNQLVSSDSKLLILDESNHPLQFNVTLADIHLQALITSSDNIKFVFSPSALENIAQRKTLMRLMSTLSRRLRKNVFVTPIARENIVLFSYSLETGWLINMSPGELKSPYFKVRCYIEDIKKQLTKLMK